MTQATLTVERTRGQGTTEDPPAPASPGPARRPISHRANSVKVTLVAAIWAMPLLIPSGPGNTAPADLFLGVFILASALWFASRAHVMRFPYMFPVGLSILAGAMASTVAYRHAYVSVVGGLISFIQDAFVLAWCIRIANLVRDPAMLRTVSPAPA